MKETITFDEFGNATYDPSRDGQAVTGAITIETEGLLRNEFTSADTFLSFFEPSALALVSSVLNIGGVDYDLGVYDDDFGSLRVIDSGGPQSCGEGCSFLTHDQVSVSDGSTSFPRDFDPALTGVFDTRSLSIGWYDPANPLGFIDLSTG